jgi:lipopolysaccharide biosynthesis glycosyltransferase
MGMIEGNISNREEIPILFCSNQQYCQHMAAAIASLLINNPDRNLRIFAVLTDEAAEERRRISEIVRRYPYSSIEFKGYDRELIKDFRVDDHITLDTYVRLFLPDFFGFDIRKIIYLDCDLLVCTDIGELWNVDLGEHIVAAVQDPFSYNHVSLGFREDEPVYNAGVLLIDVQKWRAANLTPVLVSYIRENISNLRYHDQDALNGVLRGQILPLPYKWNFTPRHADTDPHALGVSRREFMAIRHRPAIVHFTGIKPWNPNSEPHYKGLYYHYRSLTPWHDRPLPAATSAGTRRQAAKRRAVSLLKWHFPFFVNLLRRWTGLGDPVLQSKFLAGRSLSG